MMALCVAVFGEYDHDVVIGYIYNYLDITLSVISKVVY